MAWKPPKPEPKIVILDVNPIAVWFLRTFTSFKTFYVHHFSHLRCAESYCNHTVMVPDLLTFKTINYADEIILQTKSLQTLFERSFPKVKNTFVLTPSYATGLWKDNTIDVRRIVPDLPANYKLFVAFGEYKPKSNFLLILEALEELIEFASQSFREEIHVVLAGNYKNECQKYYNDLIEKAKFKPFASQITFLKQLPTIHKKTLIEACTALLHMVNFDLYPCSIIVAMSMAKPIIAIRNGFAETVLTHRISGIFVEPDSRKLASVMYKIANIDTSRTFLGNMAKGLYVYEFSYPVFCKKIKNLCSKYDSADEKCKTQV
ncbi:hypothetical protein FQR65_LT00061 [Abscondita terminalis]|nr:hypothetical protein FQR65_LT00061 [Abscondita terminalis]